MSDLLSSSLLREMRDDDPRRWLDWTVDALIERLASQSDDPSLKQLHEECCQMRDTMAAWPKDMHAPTEIERMIDRVDAIQRQLSGNVEDTTYKVTRDRGSRPRGPRSEPEQTKGRTHEQSSTRPAAEDEPNETVEDGTRYSSVRPPEERVRSTSRQGHIEDTAYRHISSGKVTPIPQETEPPKRSWVAQRAARRATPAAPNKELARRSSATPIRRVSPPSHDTPAGLGPRPSPRPPAREHHEAVIDPADSDPGHAMIVRQPAPPQFGDTTVVARHDSAPPLRVTRLGPVTVELLDIDFEHLDPALAMLHEPRGAAAEAYRALYYRIGATCDARRIMVTTSSKDEDSSVCAANLALAMAEGSDERVLLIEGRFAQPRVADLFSYTPSECFGRRLARHRRESTAPWRVAQLANTNLNLLAVNPTQATAPALDAQALSEVVERFIDSGFGYVIIDGPPAIEGSDARYVSRAVEGVVMVVYANRSRQRSVQSSAGVLGGVPIVGYVLCEA